MRLSKPLVAALFLSLSLTACRQAPRKAEASATPQVAAVAVVTAATVDWPSLYEAVGTVRARTSSTIASKIMAYAREVKVHTGDAVTAGQLLVTLDSRDLDIAIRQAQASREEAVSASREIENATAAAQANVDLAQVTFQRMQELFEKKSISNQEYDEAKAKLKVAQAAYEMTISKRAQGAARIQQASEAVASSTVTRGYGEIRAPFAGVVTEKQIEPGGLATPGSPLLTLEQSGALRLEVPVEESFLAAVRVGQAVTVTLDALDHALAARVSEIGPLVDPASRSFLVKIDLPAVPRLRSGAYGKATFSRGERRVLAIPVAAVSEQGQLQSVLAVEEGFARTRLVTIGQKQGGLVEVLSGLNAGERVVSPRASDLKDGARVEAKP